MSDLKELDELIEAGWGDVPQYLIPPDWRDHPPPPEGFTFSLTHGDSLWEQRRLVRLMKPEELAARFDMLGPLLVKLKQKGKKNALA